MMRKQYENRINDADIQQFPERILKDGNSKVSKYVAVVNMPALYTCPADAPCKKQCYAAKSWFLSNDVNRGYWRNFYFYQQSPDGFFNQLEEELREAQNLRPYKRFRWHESGDIVNYDYFCHMVDLAKKFKEITFMAYTKKYDIVNRWLDENGGKLPKNLVIIFSIWGVYGLGVNRYNLPSAYVEFKGADSNQYIPKSAHECNGGCMECGFKCWELKKRQAVVFKKH